MYAVGIDLAGPANVADTAMVALRPDADWGWSVDTVVAGATDQEIRSFISSVTGPVMIGLDAPLSYQPGGGLRSSDEGLRAELAANGFDRQYVLPPTMTRMIHLTARGMTIARFFTGNARVRIVETHPVAALLFRGIPEEAVGEFKQSRRVRLEILDRLGWGGEEKCLDELVASDHTLCATAAAIAVRDAMGEKTVWRYPADPPQHPFPLIC